MLTELFRRDRKLDVEEREVRIAEAVFLYWRKQMKLEC